MMIVPRSAAQSSSGFTPKNNFKFIMDIFSLNPSGYEQEMLELVNRMRLNPAAELNYLLNSGNPDINSALSFFKVDRTVLANQWARLTAVQPLAWSGSLLNGAYNHNLLMIAQDSQSHQLSGEADLGVRLTNAGYVGWSALAENIFAYAKSVFEGHAALAIDWGNTSTGIQNPPGHRDNLVSNNYREVGISIIPESNSATGVGPFVITQDFGDRRSFGNSWLLGVAFKDLDSDGFYDRGEGLGGVNVAISGSAGTFSTTTMTAGGYQLQVPSGTYAVIFSGGALSSPITKTATIGSANIKVDATIGNAAFVPNPKLNTSIRRFQNSTVPGTYLFAGESEASGIRTKFTNFKEEGLAFQVGVEKSDPLMQPLYRFQNLSIPGTYLFAGESEAGNIRTKFTNFKEEGIAFYVFGVGSGQGITFNRFQNNSNPGTYLFAGPAETASILANNKNFVLEGAAFEVGG